MRYAIWTAVSTHRQAADDKVSLEVQETACRIRAEARGWRESVGPFVVPGESRTRYANLRDAEDQIPPLREMLDSAKRHEYDVLVLYDYTRLRELLDPVARSLAAYGVQIYSINQPVEPVHPDEFDPRMTDASSAVQTISTLTSRAEVNNMVRRLRGGVIGRIPKGLHPSGRSPYGYHSSGDSKQPLLVDHAQSSVVIQIKDWFLAGQSTPQIRQALKERRVPPPRGKEWSDYGVRYILTNPFYCGLVRLGYFRVKSDPRTGKNKQVIGDPAKVSIHPGKHQPLWDETTRQAILDEMHRRVRRHKGPITQRLSLLLYCPEHDRPLRIHYMHGRRDDVHRVWYCPGVPGHWHIFIRDSEAIERLSERLVADLKSIQNQVELPDEPDQTVNLAAALDDLLARRERIIDALEAGALDPTTYADRVAALEQRITAMRRDLDATEMRSSRIQERTKGLSVIVQAIEEAPDFITHADPQAVNAALRALVERIEISEAGATIKYR